MNEWEGRIRRGRWFSSLSTATVGALDGIVLLVLLRWVSPADLGVATLATSLFSILELLADLGLSAALVQTDTTDEQKLSATFWLLLLSAGFLSFGLLILGPLLSAFHHAPVVKVLLWGFGLKLLLQLPALVPLALLRRELRFGTLAAIRMVGNLGDVAGKLIFAACGYTVVCFVAGPIAYALLMSAMALALRPWRPRGRPQLRAAWAPLAFGIRTSGAQLLFEVYSNIDYQIVSRLFGSTALGLYRVAYDLVLYAVQFLSGIATDVELPALSRLRREGHPPGPAFLEFARQNLAVTLPVVSLILLEAPDLLAVAFPSYAAAATAARVLCVIGLIRGMALVMPPALLALGRPELHLRFTLVTVLSLPVGLTVAAVVLGPRLGYLSVALGWAAVYPLLFVWLAGTALSTLQLPARSYLATLGSAGLTAILAFAPAMLVRHLAADTSASARLAMVSATIALCSGLLLWRRGSAERMVGRRVGEAP